MSFVIDEKEFLKKYRLDEAAYNQTGLKWELLSAILGSYQKEIPQYHALENYFSDCLRSVDNVHSVITKLKDPERLIEALIRQKIENKDLEINIKNYKDIVTDLIEIRVLHLFKEDWESVHEYITNKWALKEKPVAYVREHDDKKLLDSYLSKGCDIQLHEYGYRSITYLAISSLDNRTNYIKILSRTIFEEGWNNIDHVIREYHDIDNPVLMQYLSHFSYRIAGMADEMGSFLHVYLKGEPVKGNNPKGKLDVGNKANDALGIVEAAATVPVASPIASSITDSVHAATAGPGSGSGSPAPAPEPAAVAENSPSVKQEPSSDAGSDGQSKKSGSLLDIKKEDLPKRLGLILDARKEEHPKAQPATGAPKDDHVKDQENDQKFTLSKLKQAIQGIAPKNSYQSVAKQSDNT